MKLKLILTAVLAISLHQNLSALTIDTESLSEYKNSGNTIQTTIVPEKELPNTYLSSLADGNKAPLPEESIARRFDLLFFIALPVTYYLTLNFVQIHNNTILNQGVLSTYENYVYWNTLLIPMVVGYYDQLFIQEQKKIKAAQTISDSSSGVNLQMSLLTLDF